MEQWVMQYTSEGIAAFTYEHNNSYSKELKLAAITDYLSGKGSLVDICAKYKIRDKKLLRDWIKVYNGMPALCYSLNYKRAEVDTCFCQYRMIHKHKGEQNYE